MNLEKKEIKEDIKEEKYTKQEVENILKNYLEKNTYQWWIVSNSVVKRSFAIIGHYFLAYLMIIIPFLILAFVLGMLGVLLSR